jgi:streptomycin 6-kinase
VANHRRLPSVTRYRGPVIEVPESFLAQPRWRRDGQEWLAELPRRVSEQCRRWRLELDGSPMHGSNALVLPVLRDGHPLALRLNPPTDDIAAEVAALRFWSGRGTVLLVDADPSAGATLLERLDARRSLAGLNVVEAAAVLGRMMRRLALPAPTEVRSTADLVRSRLTTLEQEWLRLDRPFSPAVLALTVNCGEVLGTSPSTLAVNGDLHHEQVLAGRREEWLCVDPVLLSGDLDYDLARILWSRLDETDPAGVDACFAAVVEEAGLDRDRARQWVIFRSVDYWLWGLGHGLTEDPVRCARLVDHFR